VVSREDKLLDEAEREAFFGVPVTVEEKVDGANVGVSFDAEGNLWLQSRGHYLSGGDHAQFSLLWPWAYERRDVLWGALGERLILFGEWCYARHSIAYDALPDYLLAFDVYDREARRFYNVARRDALVGRIGLELVPRVYSGVLRDLSALRGLLGESAVGAVPVEGLYVRVDSGEWLEHRAKLVRAEFAQAIGQHWSARVVEPNQLAAGLRRAA